jgi:predicted MPP superfamily phosphohydrolase
MSIACVVFHVNFFPILSSPLSHNFAIVGDWGCTKDTKKTVKSIENKNPELILSLGDMSYKTNADCWLDIIDSIDENMKIIIGNHDVLVPALLKQYMDYFGLTKTYYSFDYNNIHFLMIDSESSYLPGTDADFSNLENKAQYRFVENDLSKASNNSNIKWIFVMNHRQFYSSLCGDHDSCDPIKKLRNTYHPLFDKYGVDLIFSGHAHNYQRTYPLMFNEKNSSTPIITSKETKTYYYPNGQIQLIVGTGGVSIDPLSSKEPYIAYQQDDKFGFLNINVLNNESIIKGEFISNKGKILDTFEIRKK